MRLGLAMMAAGMMTATGVLAQDHVAPGALAPSVDPGCVTVAQADPRLSPPDLALGVLACGKAGNWDGAADLYALMLLRSAFDTRRVADATAHQAGDVLSLQVGESLSDADGPKLADALGRLVDPGTPRRAGFCEAAKAAGAPQHDPGWMVQHGMGAFLGSAGDGLVPGFDPAAAWALVLTEDMGCP